MLLMSDTILDEFRCKCLDQMCQRPSFCVQDRISTGSSKYGMCRTHLTLKSLKLKHTVNIPQIRVYMIWRNYYALVKVPFMDRFGHGWCWGAECSTFFKICCLIWKTMVYFVTLGMENVLPSNGACGLILYR